MKDQYIFKEILLIGNQLLVISYMCIMAITGNLIGLEHLAQFLLLSLLFFDAAYISYRNIKGNQVLSHFSYLLLLLGWQFLLSLFKNSQLSEKLSIFLLPVCLYQSFYFIQIFVFQESAYQLQKFFLAVCKITCILSMIGFFFSQRVFSICYQLQTMLSLAAVIAVGIVHRKRIGFLCKSQKRELIISLLFIGVVFAAYIAAFHSHAQYMENMGSYFSIMLTFFSVHNIIFQYHTQQEKVFALKKVYVAALIMVLLVAFALTTYSFQLPLMAIFVLLHLTVLLLLLYNFLFYLQIRKQPVSFQGLIERKNFYAYALAQIRREEALRKEFSNYLHDDVLQDLLSLKNLVRKADRPDVQQILYDTLGKLNTSIRAQMQGYHPTMPKTMTLKENIQTLLDSLAENTNTSILLHCNDTLFLVEPYNYIFYRMIQELLTNALKHSEASRIRVLLMQEHEIITLKVSDNGIGLQPDFCPGPGHRGLSSIQEQVSLLNGKIEIHSAPQSGTQISVTMPMRGEDSYESFISR